jgi:hypothetical protein
MLGTAVEARGFTSQPRQQAQTPTSSSVTTEFRPYRSSAPQRHGLLLPARSGRLEDLLRRLAGTRKRALGCLAQPAGRVVPRRTVSCGGRLRQVFGLGPRLGPTRLRHRPAWRPLQTRLRGGDLPLERRVGPALLQLFIRADGPAKIGVAQRAGSAPPRPYQIIHGRRVARPRRGATATPRAQRCGRIGDSVGESDVEVRNVSEAFGTSSRCHRVRGKGAGGLGRDDLGAGPAEMASSSRASRASCSRVSMSPARPTSRPSRGRR